MQRTLNRRSFRQPKPVCLGRIIATDTASRLSDADVLSALCAHAKAHWGFIDDVDWDAQDWALENRWRVRSVWVAADGSTFWVITDLVRQATMVALPSDYE